jgi:hypothetical protein
VLLPSEETDPLLEQKAQFGLLVVLESFASHQLDSNLTIIRLNLTFHYFRLGQLA